MPKPGHFRLHGRAEPPLVAGDYVIEGEQTIPEETSARFDAYRGHLRVTAPRFRLPPDHVLSTFPPANSEGAYETRLPQIVLRRRTLPWERTADPADRSIPWLALVVIAEGEGSLSGETAVQDCVTPGVTLSGPNDVATGVHLTVTETVVQKVFPTKQDLPLLSHVREVDIDDTELAMGDDDGFLAVVLANRLPQFDRVGCKPVRYLACLINLEGQLDALPAPSTPTDRFIATEFVYDASLLTQQYAVDPDLAQMGVGYMAQNAQLRGRDVTTRAQAQSAALDASATRAGLQKGSYAGAAQPATVNQWRVAAEHVENVAVTAPTSEASRLVRDAMKTNFRYPIEGFTLERVYRFPVLTHWSFTTTGAGGFETLMQHLDVGLLGTTPEGARKAARPPCADEPLAGPPPADIARPAPELAETGHVGLPHLTRRGEPLRAWYRGPLTPHVMVRDREPGAEDGRMPLAHASDQLRRVVPDGREDLSLAGAFEIGRLLALSHPAIIAALMRWRREQFGAARAQKMAELAAGAASLFNGPLKDVHVTADLGRLIGRTMIFASAKDPERVLAPSRPLEDPARPVEFLVNRDIDEVLAVGFGIPLKTIHTMRERMDATVLADVAVPVAPQSGQAKFDRTALQSALAERVVAVANDVLRDQDVVTHRSTRKSTTKGTKRTKTAKSRSAGPDALDALLDVAARRRREEIEG